MTRTPTCAIVGHGLVINPDRPVTTRMLASEAVRLAAEDAGIELNQIDGAVDAKSEGGGMVRGTPPDEFPRFMGLPVSAYVRGYGRGASAGSGGLLMAEKLLEMGIANYVAVVTVKDDRTSARRSRTSTTPGQFGGKKPGSWGEPFSDIRAVSHHSFFMTRHAYEFGTTEEDQAHAAMSLRKWAAGNPYAALRNYPLTLEQYFEYPYIVKPYRRPDICVMSDGAIAFILTTIDRAKDTRKTPAKILGIGFGEHMEKAWWENSHYATLPLATGRDQAFSQAGISLADIDVAQVPDCFTAEVIMHVEDYGWCKKGEGGAFIREGNIAPGGTIPLNTGGGWNSAYHMGDMTHLSEAVIQLRGEGGDRQVGNVEVALAAGGGGEMLKPGMCSTHSTVILAK